MALADWELGELEDDFPTLNDLAVGDDGHVHVISAKRGAIGRLEGRLHPGERARVTEAWHIDGLPGGRDARPEGLVLQAGVPVVGLDTRADGSNVFVLDAP